MSEPSQDRLGPYGHVGNDVGRSSIEVLADLSAPIPGDWLSEDGLFVLSANDNWTFGHLEALESDLEFLRHPPDFPFKTHLGLHRAFDRLHAALPLTEVERQWLLSTSQSQLPDSDTRDVRNLLGFAGEVTSEGVRKVIQGREVVRRMAEWRREEGEFAHQGTLGGAREALGVIATTLIADANWPRNHEGLRAQLEGESLG